MIHLTLNTGHWRRSPRNEVSQETIAALQPMLQVGTHPIPIFDDMEVDVTISSDRAEFTVFAKHAPYIPVICAGLAWTESAQKIVSRKLQQLNAASGITIIPAEPTRPAPDEVPWLGIVLFKGITLIGERIGELGDFERCLAWTILERYDCKQNQKTN